MKGTRGGRKTPISIDNIIGTAQQTPANGSSELYDRCKLIYARSVMGEAGERAFLSHMLLYDTYRRRHAKVRAHFKPAQPEDCIPTTSDNLQNSLWVLRDRAASKELGGQRDTKPVPLPFLLRPPISTVPLNEPYGASAEDQKGALQEINYLSHEEVALMGANLELDCPSERVLLEQNYYLRMALQDCVQKIWNQQVNAICFQRGGDAKPDDFLLDPFLCRSLAELAQERIATLTDVLSRLLNSGNKIHLPLVIPQIELLAKLARLPPDATGAAHQRISSLFPVYYGRSFN